MSVKLVLVLNDKWATGCKCSEWRYRPPRFRFDKRWIHRVDRHEVLKPYHLPLLVCKIVDPRHDQAGESMFGCQDLRVLDLPKRSLSWCLTNHAHAIAALLPDLSNARSWALRRTVQLHNVGWNVGSGSGSKRSSIRPSYVPDISKY